MKLTDFSRPPYAYHGTTEQKWAEQHEGDTVLWLAQDQTRAQEYAKFAAQHGETPLLLRFSIPELAAEGLRVEIKDREPNNQTMVVRGSVEAVKHLGTVVGRVMESPMVDYEFVGPQGTKAFTRPSTLALARSPKTKLKAQRMFEKTPWNISVVFYNIIPAVNDSSAGRVRPREDLPQTKGSLGIDTPQKTLYGEQPKLPRVPPEPGVVTFVLNSDDGTNFMPFTPWMIAHRAAHSMEQTPAYMQCETTLYKMMNELHERAQSVRGASIFHALGRFKSARDGVLVSHFEFLNECFAQFLIQGKVTFNPLPDKIPNRPYTGVKKKEEYWQFQPDIPVNQIVIEYVEILNDRFSRLMDTAVGKVFAI